MMPDNNPVNDQRISLFLRKLWTLVNSKETDNVITWSEVNLFILLYVSNIFTEYSITVCYLHNMYCKYLYLNTRVSILFLL